jgi:SagB-type dehydrogenase family enzyme
MRARHHLVPALLLVVATVLAGCDAENHAASPDSTAASPGAEPSPSGVPRAALPLPRPRLDGPLSLEQAIAQRRSVRDYRDAPVTLAEAAQVLWAAQGVTDAAGGLRAAPSAGALYPLEVFLVARRVDGLPGGAYRYVPQGHALEPLVDQSAASAPGDDPLHERLHRAALSQSAVREAPAVLVIAAVFERTTDNYGERGRDYVIMEAGHAAQNVCLQAVALGLGSVVIGAFDEQEVGRIVGLAADELPLYLVPFGRRRPSSGPVWVSSPARRRTPTRPAATWRSG